MKILIQYVNIKTSESMTAYVTKKLNRLLEKYDWVVRAEVFFKKENDPTEKGQICEIQLSAPGPRLFAVSNEKNFEMAVKETISDLDKQLKKRKAQFTNQRISS